MRLQKRRVQSGFSLFEVLIAAALTVIISLALAEVMRSSVLTQLKVDDQAAEVGVDAVIDKTVRKYVYAVTARRLDPNSTFVINAQSPSVAGATWNFPGYTIPSVSYPALGLKVGGYDGAQGSFDIEIYRVVFDTATKGSRIETSGVMLSRCVDAATWTSIPSISEIQALPRPQVTLNSYRCCQGATCSGDNPPLQWPTIFIYDGTAVRQMPVAGERPVIPGFGFMLGVDANPPTKFILRLVKLQNRCRTGSVIMPRCSRPTEGSSDTTGFSEDLRVVVSEIVKPMASELRDGSYIQVGNELTEL